MNEEVKRMQAHKDASQALAHDEASDSLDLVLLGGPGSGKGTQAENLSKTFKLAHVSTGDLFRENFRNNTDLGKLAKSYIEKGELVPDDVTQDMVRDRLSQEDVRSGFILDGFPRNISQAEALIEMMTDMRRRLSGVLYINVSDDEIVKRLSGRLTCADCQTPYHETYNPPAEPGICDQCGGKLLRRDDDEPKTIKARLKTYHGQTAPLVSYFREKGLLHEINGEGEVSEINQRMLNAIETIKQQDKAESKG